MVLLECVCQNVKKINVKVDMRWKAELKVKKCDMSRRLTSEALGHELSTYVCSAEMAMFSLFNL